MYVAPDFATMSDAPFIPRTTVGVVAVEMKFVKPTIEVIP